MNIIDKKVPSASTIGTQVILALTLSVVNVLISQPSAREAHHDAEIEKTVGHFGLNETLRRLRERGII